MKIISQIRDRIELKLLVSTFMVSAAVVFLFGILIFRYSEKKVFEERTGDLIRTTSFLTEFSDSLLQQESETIRLLAEFMLQDSTGINSEMLRRIYRTGPQLSSTIYLKQGTYAYRMDVISEKVETISAYPKGSKALTPPIHFSQLESMTSDTDNKAVIPIRFRFMKSDTEELVYGCDIAVQTYDSLLTQYARLISRENEDISVVLRYGDRDIQSGLGTKKKYKEISSKLLADKGQIVSVFKSEGGIVALLPLQNAEKWCVVSDLSFQYLKQKVLSTVGAFLGVSVAMVLLITIFIDVGIRNIILLRISTLQKILNKEWIDTGAFNELRGGDEIGTLVVAFQKMSRQIQRRVEMEQLVADVSRDLAAADSESFDETLENVLRKLGLFSQSDHTYLILCDGSMSCKRKSSEWVRSGVNAPIRSVKEWEHVDLPWLKKQLLHEKALVIDTLDSFPAEAVKEMAFWAPNGNDVNSLVVQPMMIKGELFGLIGCETIVSEFSWSNFDTQLLGMVAEIVGSSIDRQRTIKVVEEQNLQLFQAQKMETVGHLAGGIAHDFNNILAGIISSTSLFRSEHAGESSISMKEMNTFLNTVESAGTRAAGVVQQLLGLSRKQEYNFTTQDLHKILQQVAEIGKNSFDKSVKLHLDLCEGKALSRVDAVQLEQVLLNFMVNGVHAMTIMRQPDEVWGGILRVTTELKKVDDAFKVDHPIAFEDCYWHIAISDTGVGIPEENNDKVFDPFFTTKEKGIGTGLGLSMIYRIIQEHYGFVEFESEVGVGTTFHIYLPFVDTSEESYVEEVPEVEITAGPSTILVVDDEPLLRKIALKILKNLGHEVLLAADGGEAIDMFLDHKEKIDAVILDLVMPVLSGRETYIELHKIDPDVPVLVSSGFRKDERVDELLEMGVSGFLQKPYTVEQLSNMISEILGKSKANV